MNKSVALKLAGAAAMAGSTQAYGQIVLLTLPDNIPGSPDSAGRIPGSSEYYDVLAGLSSSSPTDDSNPNFHPDFIFSYDNTGGYFFTTVSGIKTGSATSGVLATGPGPYFYTTVYANAVAKGTNIGLDTPPTFYSNPAPATYPSTYLTIQGGPNTIQQPDSPTYLAFQFTDGYDGLVHNGYLELETATYTDESNKGGLIFLGGAFNSVAADAPGGAGDILAGAVPEPGTISSLMLGAAALGGVGLLRRRRAAFLIAQD
jgi:hypothetical protein